MAQVRAYQSDVRLAPVTGAKQRAPNVGFGEGVGESIQGLGRATGQYAEAVDDFNRRQDEATVKDLDATFSATERDLRTRLEAAKGKDALIAAPLVQQEFQTARDKLLGQTQGARQRGMLSQVLDARQARFTDGVLNYRGQQLETYTNDSELADINAKTQDVLSLPVDSPDATVAMQATAAAIRARGVRLGWGEPQTNQALLDASTEIHTQRIAAMVDANPQAAEAYYEANKTQIDATKRTALHETIIGKVYDADAFDAVAGLPDRSPSTPTNVSTPSGTMTLHPPVASSTVRGVFGEQRPGHTHSGVDLAVPVNTPVVASAAGTVHWRNDPNGYGRYAVIDHGNGLETRYAHLGAARIEEGARVEAGQLIGLSGGAQGSDGAGNSQGPHVHYEVRRNGAAIDPSRALEAGVAEGGHTDVAAQPQSLQGAYDEADRLAEARRPGDRRYRQAMRQAMTARYAQTQAVVNDRERQAGDQLLSYFEGGDKAGQTPPASLLSAASPQQRLAYSRDRIQAAKPDATKTDSEIYGSLIEMRALNPERFAQLDLSTVAPYMTASDLRGLASAQVDIRAHPDTPTNDPRMNARRQAWPEVTRQAALAGIETGAKADDEDRTRLNGLQTFVDQEIESFVRREHRVPSREEVVAMSGRGLRQLQGERTGLFGLGGREERFNFEVIVPQAVQQRIISQYRAAAGGANPTPDEIRDLYMQGRANGTFQ